MSIARDALWESGHDESVEVNQRALIDKVLARYSGEFTVFRELLQNSDDASAKAVEIHFDTQGFINRNNSDGSSELAGPSQAIEKLPDLKTAVVHQWTFKNDGIIFRDEDWNRLKKIAEGNPDEEKIGAFGVGFYSLFSVTEEPFVTSGGQWMGFYWKDKKDQLFARRGTIPADKSPESDKWTTFTMPLREPGPPPTPFDFIRFLASSITFMAHLSEVSVFFDGKRLARLRKDRGVPRPLELKPGLKRETPKSLMRVTGVSSMPLSIRAEIMQWVYASGSSTKRRTLPSVVKETRKAVTSGFFSNWFSSLSGSTPQRPGTPEPSPLPQLSGEEEAKEQQKLLQVNETGVVLAVFSADVDVVLDDRMKRELLRATKKNAPHKMKYELIYTGKDEYDASRKEDEQYPHATGSVFQGLRADIEGHGTGRVFIGHSTGQTTGIGGHMAARFIPTVERESIDLVDRNVRIWNEELLAIGGYLARTAYEKEMDSITEIWPTSDEGSEEVRGHLRARALHALKFFTFHASTPSAQVATVIEEAFFSCALAAQTGFAFLMGPKVAHGFPIMSSVGVRNVSEVRVPNPAFNEFLKKLPVLTDDILEGAKRMVESLRGRGMIKEITFQDVLQELRSRPLTETELIACFKWWSNLYKTIGDAQLQGFRTELLDAAVLSTATSDSAGEKIVPMSWIQSFLNTRTIGSLIPTDGPLPTHLLPVSVSRHFDPQSFHSAFGWREFTISEWLQHILDPQVMSANVEFDVTTSPTWAERVLNVLARAWPSCGKGAQEAIVNLLKDKTCIPTSAGLKIPRDAYFQNVHVFPDLPHVTLPSGAPVKGALEKVLQALGVRKHVELQLIFNRMIKTGDWSIADLIKYLVAVQSTLAPEEIERLRLTPAFPKESKGVVEAGDKAKVARYKASELYEPLDVFRDLGLPVIDWGTKTKWRGLSDEAKFLYMLGLRRFPPLETILNLAGSPDLRIRSLALKYFLDNHATKYSDYRAASYSHIAFIPAIKGKTEFMAKPGEVYASPIWAIFGLPIVHPSLHGDALSKLEVTEHPATSVLVSLLETNPPDTEDVAKQWFAAMATRITDFSAKELKTLSQTLFVPVKVLPSSGGDKTGARIRLLPPSQCYFRPESNAQIHSKLFTFVDFGTQANQFLSACGTKSEPTVEEIVQSLLDDPRRFWTLAEGRDNYLAELRNIAVNRRLLSNGLMLRMKRAPILLGVRRVRREKRQTKAATADPEEDEDWDYVYDLLTAEKVVIADDTNTFQLFGDVIFTCPQEDLLEAFYMELGSRRLSSMIKEEHKTSGEIKTSKTAKDIRSLILERLPLFLHEHTHAKPRVPFSWLNNENNFVVRTFGKLVVIKTLAYSDSRSGPIELWLAGNDIIDMFEVSTSICKLLFDSPKASDALLFMTILSTDLRSLRRRGYNIDRILQKQRAERLVAEELAKEKAKQTVLVSQPTPQSVQNVDDSLSIPGNKPGPSINGSETTLVDSDKARPQSGPRGSVDTLKDQFKRLTGRGSLPPFPGSFPDIMRQGIQKQDNHEAEHRRAGEPPSLGQMQGSPSGNGPLLPPPRPSTSRPGTPGSGVTPLNNIATNIDMAIRACREERGEVLKNQEQMRIVKESLNDGYCDVSGQGGDMTYVGEMGDVKIFISREISQPQVVLSAKRDSIARFIHVLRRLSEIYNLPLRSIHIFYDTSGGLIAFNRNASLFMNLRFFEAWHDADVREGRFSQAFISWYFTLAHEIAHNLVQPHNSEHEFYFSSICEAHLPALSQLLVSV
ncbi:hypothetical protein NM688_g5219 [Phlebia brevispora]|uniref:Uncharacterized protein n=1 Tax=Phlebia brevispora TaxID=194682 RepID=A0ACC1SYQ8_9APHY|nr:hypothetical protein NM688_g5219 [Phlebia brevispora]